MVDLFVFSSQPAQEIIFFWVFYRKGAYIYDVPTGVGREVRKLTMKLWIVEDGGSGEGRAYKV